MRQSAQFIPINISGKPHVLAAYTCTPLVKFPIDGIQAGTQIKGTTIAELGNRNRPLDMISYAKDGKDFVLLANSSRGIMKVGDRFFRHRGEDRDPRAARRESRRRLRDHRRLDRRTPA